MRLSEAVRIGSLLIEEPRGGDIKACAITMAGLATGFVSTPNIGGLYDDRYMHVTRTWPWICGKEVLCPCGGPHYPFNKNVLWGTEIIWGMFDQHVMGKVNGFSMTIEGLADWIRTIEPEEHEPTNNNPLDECDVLSYSNPVAVNHK